jgi:hypothetical protein
MIPIYTNAPVNACIYFEDANGNPVALDATGTYKMQVRKSRGAPVVLTFTTNSSTANVEVLSEDLGDGITRDIFAFSTPDNSLVAALEPGMYVADLLRSDDPNWECAADVKVTKGVTVL